MSTVEPAVASGDSGSRPTGDRAQQAADRAEAAEAGAEGAQADAVDAAGAAREAAAAAGTSAGTAVLAAEIVAAAEADPLVDAAVRELEAGVDESNPFGTPGRPLRRSPFLVGFTFALGAILAWVVYRAVASVTSVLVLIVTAGFLAIGLHPTVTRLERLGLRRGMATGVVFVGVIAFFIGCGYAVVPPIVKQATALVQAAPDYLTHLRANRTFQHLDERFGIVDKLTQATSDRSLSTAGTKTVGGVLGVGRVVLSGVFNTLTVLILTLYFVSAFDRIKNAGYRLVPRARRARTVLIGDEILARVGGYVAGALSIAAIAGTTSLIWLSILRVPYPLALALFVAVTDLIPLVGATIGAIIVTAIAFFVSWPVGLATLLFYIAYQQVENFIIYPRMMKRSVDVSPAAAIVAVLVGGALLGVIGALLAIPTCAAVQLLIEEVAVPRQDAA